jgi:RNA:NAD 2'-phosphotransferase (TPT1/KptA family)
MQDGNGTIEVHELREVIRSLGNNPTEAELNQIIADADVCRWFYTSIYPGAYFPYIRAVAFMDCILLPHTFTRKFFLRPPRQK